MKITIFATALTTLHIVSAACSVTKRYQCLANLFSTYIYIQFHIVRTWSLMTDTILLVLGKPMHPYNYEMIQLQIYIHIYIYICVCVRVCVSLRTNTELVNMGNYVVQDIILFQIWKLNIIYNKQTWHTFLTGVTIPRKDTRKMTNLAGLRPAGVTTWQRTTGLRTTFYASGRLQLVW